MITIKDNYYVGGSEGPTLELLNKEGEYLQKDGMEVFGSINLKNEGNWILALWTYEEGMIKEVDLKSNDMVNLLIEAEEILKTIEI